ncbi:MAG: hypothetical protein MJ138_07185 [Kiritimatiellae bacterium]|nr:hypothetical protein [Kiritimatiellia bacterium]
MKKTTTTAALLAACGALAASAPKTDPLAARVAADFTNAPAPKVAWYAVPAMSEMQRLPDVYPEDGVPGGKVRIVAAKDEFEPGSFDVYAFENLGKVAFSLTPFKTDDGKTFPAENLDLKLVKVWFQNKNGWFSYFGDTGFKLCPDLLLNDEDLIRVDVAKQANYARLVEKDGTTSEWWINPPHRLDVRFWEHYHNPCSFLPMKENFRDAKTLQPVLLPKGEFRQFFLTAHVTKDVPAGLYKGAVEMADAKGAKLGAVPVALRVLDFVLPQPKDYSGKKDYLTASYSYISFDLIMQENGGDAALARKQLKAVLKDQVDHNQLMHMVRGSVDSEGYFTAKTMLEVGMRKDVQIGGASPGGAGEEGIAAARRQADYWDRAIGHHNIYIAYGDEPGSWWLKQTRPVYEAAQKAGFKFFIAGGDSVFNKAGYIYDWHNVAKDPVNDSSTRLWNQLDRAHVAWYANHHVGPENPAFNRRQYGLGPYLAGYSANCNYAHHFGPYNDDRLTYKPMVFAYGIYDGVIDTLPWEGFREGMDDIRYATLMTSLARKAAKSEDVDVRYLGLKALQMLASQDRAECDLAACRHEMINYILRLKQTLGE